MPDPIFLIFSFTKNVDFQIFVFGLKSTNSQRLWKVRLGLIHEKIRLSWRALKWLIVRSGPDQHFHNFRASWSGDRPNLCSSGTSFDGFWSSKFVKRSVGEFSPPNQSFHDFQTWKTVAGHILSRLELTINEFCIAKIAKFSVRIPQVDVDFIVSYKKRKSCFSSLEEMVEILLLCEQRAFPDQTINEFQIL